MDGEPATPAHGAVAPAFEAWAMRYEPIRNGIKSRAEHHGCLFDTDGEELAFVRISDERKVWTLVLDGNKTVITPGFDHAALKVEWHSGRFAIGFFVASVLVEDDADGIEFIIEENLDAMDRNTAQESYTS